MHTRLIIVGLLTLCLCLNNSGTIYASDWSSFLRINYDGLHQIGLAYMNGSDEYEPFGRLRNEAWCPIDFTLNVHASSTNYRTFLFSRLPGSFSPRIYEFNGNTINPQDELNDVFKKFLDARGIPGDDVMIEEIVWDDKVGKPILFLTSMASGKLERFSVTPGADLGGIKRAEREIQFFSSNLLFTYNPILRLSIQVTSADGSNTWEYVFKKNEYFAGICRGEIYIFDNEFDQVELIDGHDQSRSIIERF